MMKHKFRKVFILCIAFILFAGINAFAQAEATVSNVSVDCNTGNVTIEGLTVKPYETVTITASDQSDRTIMYDQAVSGFNGEYSFTFNTDGGNVLYTAAIKTESKDKEYSEFTFDIFIPRVSVTNELGEELTNLASVSSTGYADVELSVQHNPVQSETKSFDGMFVCATYSGDKLVNVKSKKLNSQNSTEDITATVKDSLRLTKAEIDSCDSVKVFFIRNDNYAPYMAVKNLNVFPYQDGLKVLTIGNSYGDNCNKYLPVFAEECGIKVSKFAYMYQGGATFETHYNLLRTNGKYGYNSFDEDGSWFTYLSTTLDAVRSDDWDIIIILSEGFASAKIEGETDQMWLNYIADQAKLNATNPDVKIGYMMPWSVNNEFTYNNAGYHEDWDNLYTTKDGVSNQINMYNAIVRATQNIVVPNKRFDFIIPTGTAVQNARTYFGCDTLSTDTLHLNTLGCYIAGLSWLKSFGISLDNISGIGSTLGTTNDLANYIELTPEQLQAVLAAVNDANEYPFEITDLSNN